MYAEIKQEVQRLGKEIEKQADICRQRQNVPRQYETYKKINSKIEIIKDDARMKSEESQKYKERKIKQKIEDIEENVLRKVKEKVQKRLQQQVENLKKINRQQKAQIDDIDRRNKQLDQRLKQKEQKEEISRTLFEEQEQQLRKKLHSSEAIAKNLQLKVAESQLKMSNFQLINRQISQELKSKRQEKNLANKFIQQLQAEILNKTHIIETLNAKINESLQSFKKYLQQQKQKEEISRTIFEQQEQELRKKLHSYETIAKNLQLKVAESQLKMSNFQLINRQISQELKSKRQEKNQTDKFIQQIQAEIQNKTNIIETYELRLFQKHLSLVSIPQINFNPSSQNSLKDLLSLEHAFSIRILPITSQNISSSSSSVCQLQFLSNHYSSPSLNPPPVFTPNLSNIVSHYSQQSFSLNQRQSQFQNSSLNRARIQSNEFSSDVLQLSSIKLVQDENYLPNFSKKFLIEPKQLQIVEEYPDVNFIDLNLDEENVQSLIFKDSYLRLQALHLQQVTLNNLIKTQLINRQLRIISLQKELVQCKGDFSNYSNVIDQLKKRIEELQRSSCNSPNMIINEDKCIQQKLTNLQNIINLINHNCLKNNCDSTGIININLKAFPQKNMDLISLSPTDLQKFNKKEDCINQKTEDPMEFVYHSKYQQEFNCFEKQEKQQLVEARIDYREVSRKKSFQSQHYQWKGLVTKLANKLSQNEHAQNNHHQQIEKVPAPSSNSKQNDKQSPHAQKSASIENNPDSEITLTYQQLKLKYHQLYLQNERMSEYLRMLHNLNHKWKKGTTEVEHHSKINVLGKLSQKLNNMVHKQKGLAIEDHEALIADLVTLIKDLQNYIHFLDHLIKIEPFQDHNLGTYYFKRIGKKVEFNFKNEKEIIAKKTYSQGCSREDEFIQNFDIYPYEPDEIPQNQQRIIKQKQKKNCFQFDKFAQQNKQLFSEISSVKNRSQWSQISSFIHSKSQLQLGQYLKHKNIQQIDEQYALKKDYNDTSKVEPKNFNDLKQLYVKLKQEHQDLMKQRSHYEKNYKRQLQKVEHDHAKKINKITKQFNQSFNLLCQRSGLHKEKRHIRAFHHKQIQVQPSEMQNIRKTTHSKTETEDSSTKNRLQKIVQTNNNELQEQLKEKQQKNLYLQTIIEKNKQIIHDLSQRISQKDEIISKLNTLLNSNIKSEQLAAVKTNKDLAQFIKKITNKQNDTVTSKVTIIPDKNKIFRKSSTSLSSNEVIPATKIEQIKITSQQFSKIVGQQLGLQHSQIFNDIIAEAQLRKLIVVRLQLHEKQVLKRLLSKFKQKFQMFMSTDFDDWYIQLQQNRITLEEYFNQTEQVSATFNLLNEIINKIRRENSDSYGSLSIHSRMGDDQFIKIPLQEVHIMRMDSKQSQDETKRKLQQVIHSNIVLAAQNEGLVKLLQEKQQVIRRLNETLKIKEIDLESIIKFNPLEEVIKQKQKEIISMQEQILALRGQATKLKSKTKRPKIYHIQN